MGESLVVQSRVKEVVQAEGDLRVSGDFSEALDTHVRAALQQAVKRAVANGRKTLQPQDL